MNLTWLQVTLTGLGSQPRLTVVVVVQLGDEGEVAGDLPVVGDLELLLLQLTELHVLKLKLQSKKKTQTRLGPRRGHTRVGPQTLQQQQPVMGSAHTMQNSQQKTCQEAKSRCPF